MKQIYPDYRGRGLEQLVDEICSQGQKQAEETYEFSPAFSVRQTKGLFGFKDWKEDNRNRQHAALRTTIDEWRAFCNRYGIALEEGAESISYKDEREKYRVEVTSATLRLTVTQQQREAIVHDACAKARAETVEVLKAKAGEWYGRLSGTAAAEAVSDAAAEGLRESALDVKAKYPSMCKWKHHLRASEKGIQGHTSGDMYSTFNGYLTTYESLGFEPLQDKKQEYALDALMLEKMARTLPQEESIIDVGASCWFNGDDGSRAELNLTVYFTCNAEPAPKLQSWT